MHQAVVLGALEYLLGLLLADQAVAALLGEELGVVVYVHAHVFFQVAAALAHYAPRTAAGARTDGDGPGVVYYALDLVIWRGVRVVLYRAADGHDAHGTHAHGEVGHKDRRAVAGIALKALGNDRVFLHLRLDGQHALHDAGHPDGIVVRLLLPVIDAADYTAVGELVDLLLRVLDAHPRLAGDLLYVPRTAHFYVHAHVRHLVGHDRVEYHVLGVGRRDAGVGSAFKAYFGRQKENFFPERHIVPSFHILLGKQISNLYL